MNKETPFCIRCKKTAGMLVSHHKDLNHANDSPDNLLVLCSNCHRDLHNKKWKLEEIGIHTPDKLTKPVPRHVLTNQQVRAVELIEKLDANFGNRWFILAELKGLGGITLHTTKALVDKGYLAERDFEGLPYYQSTW